jgi:hypothetical protein
MAKQGQKLVEAMDLRVVLEGGTEYDYRSTPVDVWRCEKLTGQPIHEALVSFGGIAALAFSCALRAGHGYRVKGQSEAEAFQAWLELIVDLQVLTDEEPAAGPLDEAQSDGSQP